MQIQIKIQIWAVRQTWGSRAGKWKHQTAKTFRKTFPKIISNRPLTNLLEFIENQFHLFFLRNSGKVGIDWSEITRYFVNLISDLNFVHYERRVVSTIKFANWTSHFILLQPCALLAETRLVGVTRQHMRREVTPPEKSKAKYALFWELSRAIDLGGGLLFYGHSDLRDCCIFFKVPLIAIAKTE